MLDCNSCNQISSFLWLLRRIAPRYLSQTLTRTSHRESILYHDPCLSRQNDRLVRIRRTSTHTFGRRWNWSAVDRTFDTPPCRALSACASFSATVALGRRPTTPSIAAIVNMEGSPRYLQHAVPVSREEQTQLVPHFQSCCRLSRASPARHSHEPPSTTP